MTYAVRDENTGPPRPERDENTVPDRLQAAARRRIARYGYDRYDRSTWPRRLPLTWTDAVARERQTPIAFKA